MPSNPTARADGDDDGLSIPVVAVRDPDVVRSEEHTSELQSRQYLVCRLLREKKKEQPPQRLPKALNSHVRAEDKALDVRAPARRGRLTEGQAVAKLQLRGSASPPVHHVATEA